MNKFIKIGMCIAILIIILFLLFGGIKIQNIILKKIYPLKYTEEVEKHSEKYGLDKLLVYAIIKAESNFEPNITSSSGACGLMQLMESTAKEIAKKVGYEYTVKEELYNPNINIMLGTKYFSELLEKYDNNLNLALSAYNAGIGNVSKWIENGIIAEDGSNIEDIPFQETNNYVRKILRDYNIYKSLYE